MIRMWDSPGAWREALLFNTINHDIQYDMVKVLENSLGNRD
jgi:hypothetical protein